MANQAQLDPGFQHLQAEIFEIIPARVNGEFDNFKTSPPQIPCFATTNSTYCLESRTKFQTNYTVQLHCRYIQTLPEENKPRVL